MQTITELKSAIDDRIIPGKTDYNAHELSQLMVLLLQERKALYEEREVLFEHYNPRNPCFTQELPDSESASQSPDEDDTTRIEPPSHNVTDPAAEVSMETEFARVKRKRKRSKRSTPHSSSTSSNEAQLTEQAEAETTAEPPATSQVEKPAQETKKERLPPLIFLKSVASS